MSKFFILAIAGASGTIARYTFGGWAHQILGFQFPFGTFIVNASGCLAIGFFGTLADERSLLSHDLRFALIFGFLGAFTTCSSFVYETWVMLKGGELFFAGLNVFANLIIWFTSLSLGVWLARTI